MEFMDGSFGIFQYEVFGQKETEGYKKPEGLFEIIKSKQ